MKIARVTFLCLVFINFISEAYGCSCVNFSPKKVFCDAYFVIRGTVQNKRTLANGDIEYDVKVEDNFKMSILSVNSLMKIRSSTDSCGVILNTGSEYLISGGVRNVSANGRVFYTHLCFWVNNWQNIPKDTQTALQTKTFTTCKSILSRFD